MTGAEALPYPPDPPPVLEAVAARCRRLAAQAQALSDGLRRDRATLSAAWQGPAAAACRGELVALGALAGSVTEALRVASRSVRGHAEVVARARGDVDVLRRRYDEAVAAHRRELAAVRSARDVPGPLRRLAVGDVQSAATAELGQLHARHRALLAEVAASARATARAVLTAARGVLPAGAPHGEPLGGHEAELAALLPMLRAARTAAGVGAGPPAAGSEPWLVRAWWAVLTGDERDRAVAAFPARVAGLAGLPAAVRGRANETVLDADLARLRAQRVLTADDRRWLDTCLVVRRQLDVVRAQADPVTRDRLVAQLLVFEPRAFGGEGRVALAVGDVDVADHVAFLVPGMGSEVRGTLGGLTADATRVVREARRAAVTARTAAVAWVGYDAPGLRDVDSDAAAEEGADLLAGDLLAVQAARDVLPHLTVVGHSYGSTTAGTALRDHATGADEAVLVGSPGPNVETARDLQVPPGHVFAGASSRDPVGYLDRFGADPTHEDFGAYRFQAEDPTRHPYRLDLDDHAKYFHAKTESLANIVAVVVGDYGALRPAAYRDEVWLLPDGINSDAEADREPTLVP